MKIRIHILGLVLALLLASTSFAEPDHVPDLLHLSWQGDPTTTMTAMWRTSSEVKESIVEYGLTSDYGEIATGEYADLPQDRGFRHTVELKGLKPATLYHYRVGGDGVLSRDFTFKTAPKPSDNAATVRFVAMGDSRSTSEPGASHQWTKIIKSAAAESPDFILFNGDAVRHGDRQEGWEDWFEKGEAYLPGWPFMMAWGNHEDHESSVFQENFAMPVNDLSRTQDYYDFRAGPVQIFFLDTEVAPKDRKKGFAEQAKWLEERLRQSDAPWKIVVQHRSVYSSGMPHGSDQICQRYFAPLFDKYHVDIDIGGHNHLYERSKPINATKPIESLDYSQGTMYIVTGGAGAEVWPIHAYFDGFRLKSVIAHHYVVVEADATRLSLTAKSTDGRIVYDKVVLTKNSMEMAGEHPAQQPHLSASEPLPSSSAPSP